MTIATHWKSFLFTTIFLGGSAFGKTVEAKKDTEVYAEATKKSSVITTLKKGQNVEAGDRTGLYWQVNLSDGKSGYVIFLNVQPKAGSDGGDVTLSQALRNAVKQKREEDDPANIRARSTVMGVRGLDESSEVAFAGNVRPNLRSVYNMEELVIKKNMVDEIGELVNSEIEQKIRERTK